MTEEEKKAIEFVQKFEENEIYKDKLEMNVYGGWKMGDIYKAELNCNLRIVLNLIQKQQAELIEQKKINRQLTLEKLKQEMIIDEMAGYLAIIRDCPNEDKGANLDCEKRCSTSDDIEAECWKLYFENKFAQ